METYKLKMESAEKNLEEFLKSANYRVIKSNEMRISPRQKACYIPTLTTLFGEYDLKYIQVTPEHVSLVGIKTPYNFNKWEILDQCAYKTKEELLSKINSFIYTSNVETIWG